MKVGLFFGSFNPVHNGHIEIAKEILNQKKFAEIWFVITPQNPIKDSSSLASYSHRVKMVELAIKNHDNFLAETIEIKLAKPNYTFNSLSFGALNEKTKHSGRVAPVVFGLGLIYTSHNSKPFSTWFRVTEKS